ncbi:MAG: hypothetical protein ACIAS6_11975 [Phycisphaerales bacterium JB060]
MPRQIVRFYQRSRLLNINLNLVLAGLIAIALAKFPVMLISDWLGKDQKLLITLIAYGLDTVLDVAVYFGLHWVANHWKPSALHGKGPKPEIPAHRKNFLMDAGRVQAERMILVPVFAAVSMGMMYSLQKYGGVSASWAFVYSFVTAILVTRTLHTISGIWTGTFKGDHHYVVKPGAGEEPPTEPEAEPTEQATREHETV